MYIHIHMYTDTFHLSIYSERMDGWMAGWMDGWMDGDVYVCSERMYRLGLSVRQSLGI